MIRANVNISGTVSKSASIRNDREGKPRFSFRVKVILPSETSDNNAMDVYVTANTPKNDFLQTLTEGKRVSISGIMDIHPGKKNEQNRQEPPSFYLAADDIVTDNVAEIDSVSGTLTFIGGVAKDIEIKGTDRRQFLVFSAYSAEQDRQSEKWKYQYVRFLKFLQKDECPEALRPDWLQYKSKVEIHGDLQLSSYKGNISISSRITELKQHIKKASN